MDIDEADVVVAAAQHQVGLLPREELPMLAANWLVAGLDTPSLRELAGLHRHDGSAAGLWPAVLAELGVDVPIADPRRVLAPWAARLVLGGERDSTWLVERLLRGIPADDVGDGVVRLLYELDDCLERIELPRARTVRDVAEALAAAHAERDRILWLLARLDPRDGAPPTPMLREQALVEAAVRALGDDLRRLTRRRWTLEEDTPGSWTVRSPDRSIPLELDPIIDGDALPPDTEQEHLGRAFADEATAHVGDAVGEALGACGARLLCRVHAAPLMICSGLWVCDSRSVHDIGDVGALRRRDAELHLGE